MQSTKEDPPVVNINSPMYIQHRGKDFLPSMHIRLMYRARAMPHTGMAAA